jgi:hypothetical protein
MNAPRNIHEVVDLIAAEVDETQHSDAHIQLAWIKNTAAYTPPELMRGLWARLGEVVTELAGSPPIADEWKLKIVSILMNEPLDVIKSRIGQPA